MKFILKYLKIDYAHNFIYPLISIYYLANV